MVARSSLKAPDALAKGDKSSRQFMEKLNDAQLPPGSVMVWTIRTAYASPFAAQPINVAPPLGWLAMDCSSASTGTDYSIREYRELAYSGSTFVVLNEAAGTFKLTSPNLSIFGGFSNQTLTWICKT